MINKRIKRYKNRSQYIDQYPIFIEPYFWYSVYREEVSIDKIEYSFFHKRNKYAKSDGCLMRCNCRSCRAMKPKNFGEKKKYKILKKELQ